MYGGQFTPKYCTQWLSFLLLQLLLHVVQHTPLKHKYCHTVHYIQLHLYINGLDSRTQSNMFEAVALGTDQQGHNNISISCREYLFLQSSKPSTLKSQYKTTKENFSSKFDAATIHVHVAAVHSPIAIRTLYE